MEIIPPDRPCMDAFGDVRLVFDLFLDQEFEELLIPVKKKVAPAAADPE